MKRFFIFIVWIMIINNQSQAMFRLYTAPKVIFSKTRNRNSTPIIATYNRLKDEKPIADIAFKNMQHLILGFIAENRKDLLDEKIMPAINSSNPDIITKVCRIDNKTVGFINYCIYAPWYIIFVPAEFRLQIRNHAKIQMIAVDENHRKKGIGSALIKQVEEDLKMKYVSRIDIGLVEPEFDSFYKKLGFKRKEESLAFPSLFSEFTKHISE